MLTKTLHILGDPAQGGDRPIQSRRYLSVSGARLFSAFMFGASEWVYGLIRSGPQLVTELARRLRENVVLIGSPHLRPSTSIDFGLGLMLMRRI